MFARYWHTGALMIALLSFIVAAASRATHDNAEQAAAVRLPANYSPKAITGPFFANPELLANLDCPDSECEGPLSFYHLMRSELYETLQGFAPPGKNPFLDRPETQTIVQVVRSDLDNIRQAGGSPPDQLDPNFLTHKYTRIQLVGIINRMDRQFHTRQKESKCGEISLIYRFAYPLSRLPVTMNVVFPAVAGKLDCKTAAKRWLEAIALQPSMSPGEFAKYLLAQGKGPLEHIRGTYISRIELYMQSYRKPASADPTDFGSEATYLIRVFRWNPRSRTFDPAILPNEINRRALICSPDENDVICERKKRLRNSLVRYLQRPDVVARIDRGTLDIPEELGVLAKRAVSVSPGGQHRSSNQPYWNAATAVGREPQNVAREQVISDDEINLALARAKAAGITLSFIGDANDFRQRLNDSSCSGCHQTRAIAGFHFPGADTLETQMTNAANAVYLPGSPQFYADQPRRQEIVALIASSADGTLPPEALATSYSARPMAKYAAAFLGTALMGGWGGACLIPKAGTTSKRDWPCQSGLQCKQLFASASAEGIGTCVPSEQPEVGDYLQTGEVRTTGWGSDAYFRDKPIFDPSQSNPVKRIFGLDNYDERRTTIDPRFLPASSTPGNSWYGSHQEFYIGERGAFLALERQKCADGTTPKEQCYAMERDRLSGGFPSGMLRLTECIGLPNESTCGLVASAGFNNCMTSIGRPGFEDFDLKTCFEYFTSFAGMRACDAASPCRDDYICVAPIHPHPKDNMKKLYEERVKRLQDPSPKSPWRRIMGKDFDFQQHGQKSPDDAWIARDDRRGVCIPPYFVFQFRSDRHPSFSTPASMMEYAVR